MSITERMLQEVKRLPEPETRRQFLARLPDRTAAGTILTRAVLVGGISLPALTLEGCAPAKTEQEMKAEANITPTLQIYEKVLEWPTVAENPDRAVTMTLGGIHSKKGTEEGLRDIYRDYNSAREDGRVPADQAAVLAVAANINEHNINLRQTVDAYQVLKERHQKNEPQAAGLASIAVINQRSVDYVDKVHDESITKAGVTPDQAVPIVQYSILLEDSNKLGGTEKATEMINALRSVGVSTDNAIVLIPAIIMKGDTNEVIAIYNEIAREVADGTPADVITDLTVATVQNNGNTADIIYMYNYGGGYYGGGTIDHCRSMRLTQGTALRSSGYLSARPNLAPAYVSHTYGQGAARPAGYHSHFNTVSARSSATSNSRVSSQGSSRPSGSYGSSRASGGFSAGRGGVSAGGVSGGG